MDTSPEYVKMCDCPEIQDGHAFEDGDWATVEAKYGRWTGAVCDVEDLENLAARGFHWLPRQDQLQEMVGAPSLLSLEHLCAEARADINYGLHGLAYESMEQFWLMAVMWYVYGKLWREGYPDKRWHWFAPGPDDHDKNCGRWVERAARRGWKWAIERQTRPQMP